MFVFQMKNGAVFEIFTDKQLMYGKLGREDVASQSEAAFERSTTRRLLARREAQTPKCVSARIAAAGPGRFGQLGTEKEMVKELDNPYHDPASVPVRLSMAFREL
jgi:hypothetical protein